MHDRIRTEPSYQALTSRLAAWSSVVLLLGSTGCRMSQPASASFASVTIQDRSEAEIARASAEVFAAEGYRGGRSGEHELIFDKEASRAATLSREGVVGTQSGAQTINRVRVEIVPLGGGQYRLQCKAFMVTGGNDPFFQDEVPLANVRRRPYQSMLNKVKKQLK